MNAGDRPRIVLGEALPGDWLPAALTEHCDIQVGLADTTNDAQVRALLTTLNTRVDAGLLARFPRLVCVSNMAVGYDNIDVAACKAGKISVGHTPGVLTEATADLAFALILAAARGLLPAIDDARAGRWGRWSPTGWLGRDLRDATLGLVGFGAIGQAVARRAVGFGMQLRYHNRSDRGRVAAQLGATPLDLPTLLATCDIVSLHAPLTPETRGLIGATELAAMRPDALLVNTSRGDLVDQDALVRALREGVIAGAALDVTSPEPLPPAHPLFGLRNCLVTPHIGSAAAGTRRSMAQLACANLLAALAGQALPHLIPDLR